MVTSLVDITYLLELGFEIYDKHKDALDGSGEVERNIYFKQM